MKKAQVNLMMLTWAFLLNATFGCGWSLLYRDFSTLRFFYR